MFSGNAGNTCLEYLCEQKPEPVEQFYSLARTPKLE